MVSLSTLLKKKGRKMSNMQNWNQNVASIIDYAQRNFPEVEIVSRTLDGKIHKSNYGELVIH